MVVRAVLGEPRLRHKQQVTCRALQHGGPSLTATTFPPTVPTGEPAGDQRGPARELPGAAPSPGRFPPVPPHRLDLPRRGGWNVRSTPEYLRPTPGRFLTSLAASAHIDASSPRAVRCSSCTILRRSTSTSTPPRSSGRSARSARQLSVAQLPHLPRRSRCGRGCPVGAPTRLPGRRCVTEATWPTRAADDTRPDPAPPRGRLCLAGSGGRPAGSASSSSDFSPFLFGLGVRLGQLYRDGVHCSPGRVARLRSRVVGGGHLGAASCWAVRRRRSLWWSTAWVTRAMTCRSSTR